MFTHESIKWIIAFVLLAVVAIGGTMVTSLVVVAGDETEAGSNDVVEGTTSTVNPDPNEFTSELDSLRQMGQAEAIRVPAGTRLSDVYEYASVYEHTSDLDALREYGATIDLTASNREDVVVSDAIEFTSQLDRLRETGQQAHLSPRPAGEVFDHTSDLDTLRAKAAAASLPDHSHADVVISDVNEYISYLDNLREMKDVTGPEQNRDAARISDANAFTSYLDSLRLTGQHVSSIIVSP